MNTKIIKRFAIVLLGAFSLLVSSAFADAPLKSTLDLDIEQAAKVAEIQKKTREEIRPVRGELHRQERALRRARIENDAEALAKQEKLVEPLQAAMEELLVNEELAIRAVLTPEQLLKYDVWLEKRNKMVGSSRDVKEI